MKQDIKQYQPADFEFINQIGVTKFGVCFLAKELRTSTFVAIKILSRKKYENTEMYQRLQNEIEVHSRLKHPSIAELYCYFHHRDSKQIYIIQEFCAKTLFQKCQIEKTYLLQKEIVKIMHQLISALDYLEKRFVIHRDIKLENLLFDEKGNLKLTNFDCCIHSKSPQNTFCGTTQYMAPEIVLQQQYDQKIDIYSAGIVFYELFYWTTPFERSNEEETLKAIKENKFVFVDKIREIPLSAKDLISEMLQKDPLKRPTAEKALGHKFFSKYTK